MANTTKSFVNEFEVVNYAYVPNSNAKSGTSFSDITNTVQTGVKETADKGMEKKAAAKIKKEDKILAEMPLAASATDAIREDNVNKTSSSWVESKLKGSGFPIPFNDNKTTTLNGGIIDAINKCGGGQITEGMVYAFVSLETGGDIAASATYNDLIVRPGFASERDNSSASGFMQVVYGTAHGLCGNTKTNVYPEFVKALATLRDGNGMTDEAYNFFVSVSNGTAKSKNTVVSEVNGVKTYVRDLYFKYIKRYPMVGLYLGVLVIRSKMQMKGISKTTPAASITPDQFTGVIKAYYDNTDVVGNAKYFRTWIKGALKIYPEATNVNVLGNYILKNYIVTSPEVFNVTYSVNDQEIAKASTAVDGLGIGGNTTPDNQFLGDESGSWMTLTSDEALGLSSANLSGDGMTTDALKDYEDIMNKLSAIRVDVTGIIGLPVRFSRFADARMGYDDSKNTIDRERNMYGRVYTEHFLKFANLVALTPGVPEFMYGFKSGDKLAMMNATLKMENASNIQDTTVRDKDLENAKSDIKTVAANANGKEGRTLYSFSEDSATYQEHCRRLIVVTAAMMNISSYDLYNILDGNEKSALKISDYKNLLSDTLTTYNERLFAEGSTISQFYFTGDAITDANSKSTKGNRDFSAPFNTILYNSGPIESSESLSNSVRNSQFESLFNMPMSDWMKDMSFLMNVPVTSTEAMKEVVNSQSGLNAVTSTISGIFGLNSVASKVSKLFANIKMPKVFGDSSYSKRYNIKIKLSSPSGDKLARFKYVIMPLLRLIPYFAPRQYGYYPDAIISPMLVQCYSKGLIACELGMVTEVMIDRHVDTAGIDGIPTEIDVTFTITELNPFFSIPFDPKDTTQSYAGYLSSGAMSFISTLSGVPLYRGDSKDAFKGKWKWAKAAAGTVLATPQAKLHNKASKMSQSLYKKIGDFKLF